MNAPLQLALFAAALALVFAASALRRRHRPEAAGKPPAARGHADDAGQRRPRGARSRRGRCGSSSRTELRRGRRDAASGSSTSTAHRARLRRRAHQAHAPDRRPPRPDRLPAPAPRAARRRHLDDAAAGSPTAGSYRLFADFSPRRRAADARAPTCASTAPRDLRAAPAPAPARAARRRLRRARSTRPTPTPATRPTCASRSPATASPSRTEPYLGAGGHLVALREGDLAFLHVHPTDEAGATRSLRGDVPDRGPLPPVPAVPARRRASTPSPSRRRCGDGR